MFSSRTKRADFSDAISLDLTLGNLLICTTENQVFSVFCMTKGALFVTSRGLQSLQESVVVQA